MISWFLSWGGMDGILNYFLQNVTEIQNTRFFKSLSACETLYIVSTKSLQCMALYSFI